MLILHKLLPLIVSPLGVVVLLILMSVMAKRRGPAVLALAVLLVCALPATERMVWRGLESDYPYQEVASAPATDAIIVLSGMLEGSQTDQGIVSQWGGATDRYFAGVDLFQAEKAPLMIFTQGGLPWSDLPLEGGLLARRAIASGVPEAQILLTGLVHNTEDEAREVSALMELAGLKTATLVTSSFHLPRAVMIFEHEGVDVIPYPTDFRAGAGLDWMSWIPSADAFGETSNGLREYIGRAYYWAKYRLAD
jgi:uncharacterized SAM-binding protein YcdF (DUF218 family)